MFVGDGIPVAFFEHVQYFVIVMMLMMVTVMMIVMMMITLTLLLIPPMMMLLDMLCWDSFAICMVVQWRLGKNQSRGNLFVLNFTMSSIRPMRWCKAKCGTGADPGGGQWGRLPPLSPRKVHYLTRQKIALPISECDCPPLAKSCIRP